MGERVTACRCCCAHGRARAIAFTTRQGGVSGGSFASLNLGFATGGRLRRAWPRTAGARWRPPAPTPRRAVSLRQRHGSDRRRGRAGPGRRLSRTRRRPGRDGDALVTGEPGLPLIAHGADCLTAALVGGRRAAAGRRARGLARAGRGRPRGCGRARRARASRPSSGPGPAPAATRSARTSPARCVRASATTSSRSGRADLADGARRALERAGAAEVVTSGLCTICDPARFHSHRRDGAAAAARP